MSERLMEYSCSKFVDALAAKTSVPGGGGAAAYVGALSVALCSMVGNFTTGKKKYAEHEDDVRCMLAEGETIRKRLLELVDEDAAAFEPLSRAYGIPKEDPIRAETLERCTKDALQGPFQMMKEICRTIELLEEMNAKGSRLLISDVGCGATLAAAALQAAAMNVFINTKELEDRAYAQGVDAECESMLSDYVPRAQAVAQQVMNGMRV